MRLLGVELGRFRSRRAVTALLLLATVLVGLLAFSTVYDTRPPDATEQAAAERSLAQDQKSFVEDLVVCQADPARYLGDGATAEDCASMAPSIDWYLSRPQLDLHATLNGVGTLAMILLAGTAILVGTTFAGADWASGSMSNQLLFQPRRVRLWVAKGVAVALGTTLAAAAILAAFWGVLGLTASSRGLTVADATWTAVVQASGRDLALVAASALGSFALTMLLRSTVGTLGLLFGYVVAGEGLAAALPFDKMSQWSLAHNVVAFIQRDFRVYDDSICAGRQHGGCSPYFSLTAEHAAVYLGVLLALAVAASVVSFRTRDVP